jgi:hypothetical protein
MGAISYVFRVLEFHTLLMRSIWEAERGCSTKGKGGEASWLLVSADRRGHESIDIHQSYRSIQHGDGVLW